MAVQVALISSIGPVLAPLWQVTCGGGVGWGAAALKPASRGPAQCRHASKMRSSLRHPFLGSGRRCHESASDLEARHSWKPNEPHGRLIATRPYNFGQPGRAKI